jgi:hypothetical protein
VPESWPLENRHPSTVHSHDATIEGNSEDSEAKQAIAMSSVYTKRYSLSVRHLEHAIVDAGHETTRDTGGNCESVAYWVLLVYLTELTGGG